MSDALPPPPINVLELLHCMRTAMFHPALQTEAGQRVRLTFAASDALAFCRRVDEASTTSGACGR